MLKWLPRRPFEHPTRGCRPSVTDGVGGAAYLGPHGLLHRATQHPHERDLPLHRVRLAGREVGRALRRVPGVGQRVRGRGGAPCRTTAATAVERPAVPIGEIDVRRAVARPTGVDEFDRVLGGGIVPGAVVLLAGEPGIGKSTLLLDVAARAARSGEHGQRGCSTSAARSPRRRCAPAPSASRRSTRTLLLAGETDLAHRARPDRARRAGPRRRSTRCRPSHRRRSRARPAAWSRCARSPPSLIQVAKARGHAGAARRARDQGRLGGRAPHARAPRRRRRASSRATGTRACACCGRPRTGTAPPTRSAASTCPTSASSGSRPQRAVRVPGAPPRSPARA